MPRTTLLRSTILLTAFVGAATLAPAAAAQHVDYGWAIGWMDSGNIHYPCIWWHVEYSYGPNLCILGGEFTGDYLLASGEGWCVDTNPFAMLTCKPF